MARSARSRARYTWPLGGLRLPRDPWWLNIYVILSSILSQTVSVIIFYMHPNQKPLPRSKAKQCVAAVSNNKLIQKMVMIMPFFLSSPTGPTQTFVSTNGWIVREVSLHDESHSSRFMHCTLAPTAGGVAGTKTNERQPLEKE